MKKACKNIGIAVVAGVILLLVENTFFDNELTTSKVVGENPTVDLTSREKPLAEFKEQRKSNIYFIQTGKTYELFGGHLSLTLKNTLNFSNSKADLSLSQTGKSVTHFNNLALGEKIFYEQYEITFIETDKNIMTYDIKLKIIEI